MNRRTIYYLNWEKDVKLISWVISNEQEIEYIQLENGESLYNNLCSTVEKSFQLMKELTPISSHHRELNKCSYTSAVYSLVYQWEAKQVGLLDVWAQLGCKLARNQHFTNGNKRTAY